MMECSQLWGKYASVWHSVRDHLTGRFHSHSLDGLKGSHHTAAENTIQQVMKRCAISRGTEGISNTLSLPQSGAGSGSCKGSTWQESKVVWRPQDETG